MKCGRRQELTLLLAIAAVGILVATCQIHSEGAGHERHDGAREDRGGHHGGR